MSALRLRRMVFSERFQSFSPIRTPMAIRYAIGGRTGSFSSGTTLMGVPDCLASQPAAGPQRTAASISFAARAATISAATVWCLRDGSSW